MFPWLYKKQKYVSWISHCLELDKPVSVLAHFIIRSCALSSHSSSQPRQSFPHTLCATSAWYQNKHTIGLDVLWVRPIGFMVMLTHRMYLLCLWCASWFFIHNVLSPTDLNKTKKLLSNTGKRTQLPPYHVLPISNWANEPAS